MNFARSADVAMERGSNIILIGAMGSGKSAVGWLLARLVGYGFVDLDRIIERRAQKPVHQIFEDEGEAAFRSLERELVQELSGLRSHVVAAGGGTVMDEGSWQKLQELGATVWLNPPAAEIARRLFHQETELKSRPLLAEVLQEEDKDTRLKLLTERLVALIGNRAERYREASLEIADIFSTPESTALLVKDRLQQAGLLDPRRESHPLDRWRIF